MNSVEKGVKFFAIFLAGVIILSIFGSISFGLSFLSHLFDDKASERVQDFHQVYDNIASIAVDVSASDIEIVSGSSFIVDGYDVSNRFQVKNKNGKLSIEDNFSFFWNHDVGKIVITVPDVILNQLDISAGAGKVSIDSVRASSFDLDQGAGVVTIHNSFFEETDIDGGAGTIEVRNSTLKNLDLDTGAGKVDIEAYVLGHSEVSCGVGKFSLTLLGNKSDYRLHVEKGIGSILVDHESYASDSVIGNGSHSLDIDGGVGAIEVQFGS